MPTFSLNLLIAPLQLAVFLYTMVYIFLSIPGLFPLVNHPLAKAKSSFAIVIPAYNEAQVIIPLLDSLNRLNYPKELYTIFVIADNCHDQTAELAREHGAIVYERFDELKKSKGHALSWFFEQLWLRAETFDAVAIFDADNLVEANFLLEMNDHLQKGEKVIQGYIESKNPEDSWISSTFTLGFWIVNRLQLSRYRIGVSTQLFGTGMCIATEVLRSIGWTTKTLTEDLEFSMLALLKGYKTTWAHKAIVFDERVASFEACWRQQIRWQQGRFEVILAYLPAMCKGCLLGDADKVEASLNLLSSVFVMLSGILGLLTVIRTLLPGLPFLQFTPLMPQGMLIIFIIAQLLTPLIVLLADHRPKRYLLWIPLYSFYMVFWVLVTWAALLNFHDRSWNHTQHQRSIRIEEIKLR